MPVFSPHDPISDPKNLFGRDAEQKSLKRYIENGGAQPLVTGYRGIGKTSLANCYLRGTNARVLHARCGHMSTFGSICKDLLEQIDEALVHSTQRTSSQTGGQIKGEVPLFASGEGNHNRLKEETRKPVSPDSLHYRDLYRAISKSASKDQPTLIVIEEIDTLRDDASIHSLVELIKACSDDWSKDKISVVCVGIQSSVTSLILKHKSLNRCAKEVFLETIQPDDLKKIIKNAEKKLKVRFPDAIAEHIAQNSGGFPYYTHMMADYCVQELENEDSGVRDVSLLHYERAQKAARKEAYRAMQSEISDFLRQPETTEAQILRYLSESKSNRIDVARLIRRVATITDSKPDIVREKLWSLVKTYELLYFHSKDRMISFIGPSIRPFIASQFKSQLKSLGAPEQQSLPGMG